MKAKIQRIWHTLRNKKRHIAQIFKQRPQYGWYCAVLIFMWASLIGSIASEWISSNSIIANIRYYIPIIATPPLFKIEAVRKTAETVGFGSILIAWIYVALDREELGFKYGDLLLAMYPAYHWFVLGHLLSVLACVWLTETGMLEGAFLALMIVIYGCIIHWKALSNLVFLSDKRRNVALDEWGSKVAEDWEDLSQYKPIIYNLTDALSIHDRDCYEKMQQYLTLAVLKFSSGFKPQDTQQNGQILSDVSHMWDHLMRGRPNSERILLLDSIFHSCNKYPDYQTSIGPICAGYILWLHKDSAANAAGEKDHAPLLLEMNRAIAVLKMRLLGSDYAYTVHCLDAIFVSLGWMYFVCGESRLLGEISFPHLKEGEHDKNLLHATLSCIFSSERCNQYFDIAFRQTFSTEEDQCEATSYTS